MIGFLTHKLLGGTKNERDLKKMQPLVQEINALEPDMQVKSDDELKAMTGIFRERLEDGATLDDLLPETFAVVRESSVRVLKMRHYDVQLVGGIVLHRGTIAEMKTGEGKTLVATLPAYLNALPRDGVHIVTVNDYLARRDAEWMAKIYNFLGLSVGVIVHGITDEERQDAYRSDITYGQNNEFGFDYLRDNMKLSPDRMVQGELNFAIVDEVDSILIDEARTPLIISGPAEKSADLYMQVDQIIPRLKKDVDYTVDEENHSAVLSDQGIERVETLLGVGNLYDPKNLDYNHHVNQALRAHSLYKRDVNYLIEDQKILIIDEHTGRKMPGRRWSDGLHQAIEAKENVTIEEENQTLATVTFQNFFRMYNKLSGMTGTAETEAEEFHKIYKLGVNVIPTNKPLIREDHPDLVYKNERGKFRAVFQDLLEAHDHGQPILIGTVSVEKSEVLSKMLKKKGIPHEVLNAKQHEREAHVVAQAGRLGAITLSTNMAGRGTDIVLGGNAEFMAKQETDPDTDPEGYEKSLSRYTKEYGSERDQVLEAGGLYILGTERHESRRIDNQLRGRSARQGDPGASRFYLSLEDDLLRIFGAERITRIMERLGMEEDVPIEHGMVSRAIANAQKKVEGHNFDMRKHLLDYDDVMNQQRKTIYALRRQVLEGRYAPELSDDDKKAGKQPQPPTTSGDWTVESQTEALRPDVEGLCDAFLKIAHSADANKPTWRDFRSEVWRQFGSLVNVRDLYENAAAPQADQKAVDRLVQHLLDTLPASSIQQRERILDLADRMIGDAIATCCFESHAEDWQHDQFASMLRETFHIDIDIDRSIVDRSTLAESIWTQVETLFKEREKELTPRVMLAYARHFFLQEIDSVWMDHLKAMDHLREGIGLRGYAQKDPKQEYKKEGFDLFALGMAAIDHNGCAKIFRMRPAQDNEVPAVQRQQRKMVASHAERAGEGGEAREKQGTVRRKEPKVGRNDPCPCKSGKKYKKCHGAAPQAAV